MKTSLAVAMLMASSTKAVKVTKVGSHPRDMPRSLVQLKLSEKTYAQDDNVCMMGVHSWEDEDYTKSVWSGLDTSIEFDDVDFPAQLSSLYVKGYYSDEHVKKEVDELVSIKTWHRPTEILAHDYAYTKTVDQTLEFCKDPKCADYKGTASRAVDKTPCVDWSIHGYTQPKNYCRNPDGSKTTWCFISKTKMTYKYCDPPTATSPPSAGPTGPPKPSLWGKNGPQPAGVDQSQLGDCWFLATAASLAEYPERVKKLFVNTEYSPNGAFEVKFFNGGKPVTMLVDDNIPMDPSDKSGWKPWSTSMSVNGAWWMPILEKGYAKFNAFYSNLSGGDQVQALNEMTNMPVVDYKIAEIATTDAMFKIAHEADQKKWVMLSGCHTKMDGLQDGHVYSVLDAVKLTDADGQNHDLLKMRNPWSSEGYKGPWGDQDPRWTPAMMAKYGMTKANDGVFFMPATTLKKAFDYLTVGMYQDWKTFTYSNQSSKPKHIWTMKSTVDQEMFIALRWTAARRFPRRKCDVNENSKQNYNLFVKNVTTGKSLAHEGGSQSLGYIYYKFPTGIKKGDEIQVYIVDFNLRDGVYKGDNQHFTMMTYGDKAHVPLIAKN